MLPIHQYQSRLVCNNEGVSPWLESDTFRQSREAATVASVAPTGLLLEDAFIPGAHAPGY